MSAFTSFHLLLFFHVHFYSLKITSASIRRQILNLYQPLGGFLEAFHRSYTGKYVTLEEQADFLRRQKVALICSWYLAQIV